MTPVTRALFRAVADGDVSLLRGLLAQGIDVNSTNQAGQTALMLAAAFKRNEIVRLLLSKGADVEARDDLGLTVHDWAGDESEIIELLTTTIKPPEIEAEPTREAAVVTNDTEIAELTEISEPPPIPSTTLDRPTPFTEEPVLKGLAAAILRDHAPKAPVNPIQLTSPDEAARQFEVNIDDQPTPVHQVTDVSMIDESGDEATDNTWGSRSEAVDDTAAPRARPLSRSRIFDLRSSADFVKPISKVEIPTFTPAHTSKSGVVVWALVVIVLVAGGFGGYRLATSLLASRSTNAATPATTAPAIQPAPAPKKLAPLVGGDVVGAELHLPDAEYPTEATQTGKVTVQVRVSRKGIVVGAKAIDGDESFSTAAESAAKKSAFSPEKLLDKPALMDGTITYHFVPPQLLETLPTEQTKATNASDSVTVTTGGPLAGTELNLIEPDHPSSAGIGTVTVVVRVSRSGRVVSWRPLDGEQRLRSAAVKAARRSTFASDKLPGEGDVVGTITYAFR
jgi:hypothetical protein